MQIETIPWVGLTLVAIGGGLVAYSAGEFAANQQTPRSRLLGIIGSIIVVPGVITIVVACFILLRQSLMGS